MPLIATDSLLLIRSYVEIQVDTVCAGDVLHTGFLPL